MQALRSALLSSWQGEGTGLGLSSCFWAHPLIAHLKQSLISAHNDSISAVSQRPIWAWYSVVALISKVSTSISQRFFPA
jgi:hypothetical protein